MPLQFGALRSRNFRLYFAGQSLSLIGTWMQHAAMLWLAYRLSGSTLVLGSVAFASQIPILIFGFLGGTWIDRFNRRSLLLLTQTLSMLQSLLLALLTWQEILSVDMLIVLAFILGCLNAVDVPARQSIAAQLVQKPSDLQNAIALNSIVIQIARFTGPALAGALVVMTSEALCFLLNALSYLTTIIALLMIRIQFQSGRPTPTLQAIQQGIRYALNDVLIRRLLLLVAAVSFLGMPYTTLMPVFAKAIFGGNAGDYGALLACAGAGSFAASLLLASLTDTSRLSRWIGPAAAVIGICLILFSRMPQPLPAYPVLFVLGFAVIIVFTGSSTQIQLRVNETMRGRVMAIYTMAFLGIAPLGSLAVGSLAEVIGVRSALLLCGIATLIAGGLRSKTPANQVIE